MTASPQLQPDVDAALKKELELLLKRSFWQRIEDYLFGYDFFISYRWEGGKTYAVQLAKALAERGFDSFLDSESYQKGDDWQEVGAAAIRRTSQLIVVGSDGVGQSQPVLREVKIFAATGRKIIPIDFDGSLDAANLGSHELAKFISPEILKIHEKRQCLNEGPSMAALDELQKSFSSLRQSAKRMRALRLVASVLGVLLAVSIALGYVSERRRAEAVDAREAEKAAKIKEHESLLEAQRQQRLESAHALATSALLKVGENSQLSLEDALKSIEATAQDNLVIPESMNALHASLQATPIAGTLWEQQSAVLDLALSPDGHTLLSLSANGVLKAWNLDTRHELFDVPPQREGEGHVEFSPTGKYFVISGPDGIRLWSTRSHRQLWTQQYSGPIAFTPDDEFLLAVNSDSVIYLDCRTGNYRAGLRVGLPIGRMAISPDGRLLAVSAESSESLDISLWDLRPNGKIIGKQLDSTRVYAEAVRVATLVHEDTPSQETTVRRVSFTQDNTRLVVATKEVLLFWSIQHNRTREAAGEDPSPEWKIEEIKRDIDGKGHGFSDVAYSRDGQWIASAGEDGEVRVWSIPRKTVIWRYPGHKAQVNCVRFTPDGKRLVSAGYDGTIKIWKVSDFGEAYTAIVHRDYVLTGIGFSRDGKYVANFGVPGTEIWSVETGKQVALLPPGSNSFDPIRDYLAIGGQVYDWKRDKNLFQLKPEGIFIDSEFSPDGRFILSKTGHTVGVWSGTDGSRIGLIPDPGEVLHAHWDHSGRRIATAGLDRIIRIWDSHSFALRHELKGHQANVLDFAFDPTGKWLASCDHYGNAILWDVEKNKIVRSFKPDVEDVRALDFSPDGLELATVGLDSTIRLWDPKTGIQKSSIDVGYEEVTALRYSPDGRWLAVATLASDRKPTDLPFGLRHRSGLRSASAILIYTRKDEDLIRLARKRAGLLSR